MASATVDGEGVLFIMQRRRCTPVRWLFYCTKNRRKVQSEALVNESDEQSEKRPLNNA